MNRSIKICAAIVVLCMLLCQAGAVMAGEDDQNRRERREDRSLALVDLVVVRPLSVVVTVVGFFGFLVCSPVALVTDNVEDTWDVLVAEPANYTFIRPLGRL